VVAAMATARTAKCQNNAGEITKALTAYHISNDKYPKATGNKNRNWVQCIFEQLGDDALHRSWSDGSGDCIVVEKLTCPDDEIDDRVASLSGANPTPPLSYVGNNRVIRTDRAATQSDVSNAGGLTTTPLIAENMRDTQTWNTNDAGLLTFQLPDTGMLSNQLTSYHGSVAIVGFCDGHATQVQLSTEWGGANDLGIITPGPDLAAEP